MSAGEGKDPLAETQLPAPRTLADYYHLRKLLEALIVKVLRFPRFCGLGCDKGEDSHEQEQERSALRPGV